MVSVSGAVHQGVMMVTASGPLEIFYRQLLAAVQGLFSRVRSNMNQQLP